MQSTLLIVTVIFIEKKLHTEPRVGCFALIRSVNLHHDSVICTITPSFSDKESKDRI